MGQGLTPWLVGQGLTPWQALTPWLIGEGPDSWLIGAGPDAKGQIRLSLISQLMIETRMLVRPHSPHTSLTSGHTSLTSLLTLV